MADLLLLVLIVAFFGLMVLLVKACDHIIGSDDLSQSNVGSDPEQIR
jgi:hypothetical protein